MLSSHQSIELKELMEQGKSFLISGGTHTGKTTLLNALLSESPPQTRLITAEEVFELSPDVPDMINMQCRESVQAGEAAIDLRRLVKESLRMRPTRLVIGEVRGAEALELLIALNSGVPGAASIHANSAAEAIEKLTLLPMLAGENFPLLFVKQLVNRAIDVVIHLAIDPISGKRKIEEIFQVAKVIKE
jgi:pilus assembly protein CpaF